MALTRTHVECIKLDMDNHNPQADGVASNDRQISIRIPADLVGRLDALVSQLESHPEFGAMGVSRNGTIRLALTKGLEVLEAGYGPPPEPKARPVLDEGEQHATRMALAEAFKPRRRR